MIRTLLSFRQIFFNLTVLDLATACFYEVRASNIATAYNKGYWEALASYCVVYVNFFFMTLEFAQQFRISSILRQTKHGKQYFALVSR